MKTGKCSLCKGQYVNFGHNPEPLKHFNKRCCDECNRTRVIPARLEKTKMEIQKNENRNKH